MNYLEKLTNYLVGEVADFPCAHCGEDLTNSNWHTESYQGFPIYCSETCYGKEPVDFYVELQKKHSVKDE